ncbi:serine/threonine-protein kinase VRK3 [Menidia menidia]
MPFQFCPQCGVRLRPDFRFCPSCGEKLPCSADESGPHEETAAPAITASPALSTSFEQTQNTVSPRPALRKARNASRPDRAVKFSVTDDLSSSPPVEDEKTEDVHGGCRVSPSKQHTVVVKARAEVEPPSASSSVPAVKSPRPVRGKAKLCSPIKKAEEEDQSPPDKTGGVTQGSAVDGSVSSPITRSPVKATGRSKAKKARLSSAVEPLQDGEEVTDKMGKRWKLAKLLSQSSTELLYEVSQSSSSEADHILKLGAKDGRIFNEQNFLQRAAKPASVVKWIKQNKMDFLGIPACVGFGLHADSYRFLIFPDMGRSLHSVFEEEKELLSEKVVLQLACRILDALEFIHSNEYVHADINAENIFIKPGQKSQVYLAGYGHAFRYCPGGHHVEYREASRTSHEGAVEFISLDVHKGAAPSRRSDLQSLGYCMLHWLTGALPWSQQAQPAQVATQKQKYMEDVKGLLSQCFGRKSVSGAFQNYLTAAMGLQYTEEPDYGALSEGLSGALQQLGGAVELPLSLW